MLRALGGALGVKPIFGAPQSQSSLRRANINFFFPMIFLTRATDFAEKEGPPVVYKSTSLFISRAAF